MHWKARRLACLWIVVCVTVAGSVAAAVDEAALDQAFKTLKTYDWGQSRAPLGAIDDDINATHGNARARKALEKHLAAVLGTDAPYAAKQFVCRKLSLIGTAESVPALAALLTDKDLSHMARYTLQRVPDAAATEALRKALPKVSGELKIGVINSLGERRDAKAVSDLVKLARGSDQAVASAAAAALGKIGGRKAVETLQAMKAKASPEIRTVVADALLLCADRCRAEGDTKTADSIYGDMYDPKEPKPVRLAALRGLAATGDEKAVSLITEALTGDDPALAAAALQMARETPGKSATKAFADLAEKGPPERQVQLLGVLAARGDPAAKPAVVDAAKSPEETVRVAALKALETVGDASVVTLLAETAAAAKGAEQEAARLSLTRLSGPKVDKTILDQLKKAEPPVTVELIRSLATRGTTSAIPELLKVAKTAREEPVRIEALRAMGVLADERTAGALVEAVTKAKGDGERRAAEQALTSVCTRAKNLAACAGTVVAGLKGASAPARCALFRVCGRLGGPKALDALRAGIKDADATVQDAATRAMAETPDIDAADDLLTTARTSSNATHQVLALQGYVRLVSSMENLGAGEKFNRYRAAMEAARRPDEKRLVLGHLGKAPTHEALKMAEACLADEALKEEAASALVSIAEGLAAVDKQTAIAALHKVLNVSQNQGVRDRASKALDQLEK